MKILFTDLDGTLLNDQSMVSKNTKAFLDDFTHAGNKLVLTSGRPLLSILEVKEQAGLDYPGILISASNGTLVYDCDSRTPILEKRLTLSQVAYLQAQARAFGLHIQTYTEDSIVSPADNEEVRFYRRRIHLPLLLAEDYASVLPKGPLKMLAIHLSDHGRLTAFCEHIADWAADRIQYIFSNDFYLELFHKDAGKGSSVRFICDHFQIPLADSFAAREAGCGIAMQNAAPEVKKAADVITAKDNDNDGLAEFMKSVL